MAYDTHQFLKMTSDELDELFSSVPAGDLPDGEGKGTPIIAAGTSVADEIAEFLNFFAWKGKVFDASKGLLKNEIGPFGMAAIVAKFYKGESWFDGKECIVLDYSETSLVAGWIRDEIRMVQAGLYLGQVFGHRKRLFHFALQF